ncbi:helix-turn-helix domain-containing protein [Kribbella sp. NBC_01505]|uniref:helix-turn-helix domain-containing protein n=1 Tax=Kribbella sp. NBC_01505 TaxID=2903580 RepID=UPI003865EDC4
MELGEVLRARRAAAGRTIASVAVDAGLSVPYIANLENGRGNPTMAALERLAGALGAQLEVRIADEEPPPPSSAGADLLVSSERAGRVVIEFAAGARRTRPSVRADLVRVLDALGDLLGQPPTTSDLDRLLDLVLLAEMRSSASARTD